MKDREPARSPAVRCRKAPQCGTARAAEGRRRAACCGIEDVKERPPEIADRRFVAEARHRAPLQCIEPADVVQSHDVIGVAVREDDRVDAADTKCQRLRADVGACIDQQRQPIIGLDEDRGTPSFVARIGRTDTSRSRSRSSARRATFRCQET